jgi:hypothetical protein
MSGIEEQRDAVIDLLAGAYAAGALRTSTFEARLDLALRAPNARRLHEVTWDVAGAYETVRARTKRWMRQLDVLLQPLPPPLMTATLDLEALGDGTRWSLGRDPECDWCVRHITVSRRHAELTRRAGHWFLRDLRSTNGLWEGTKRVAALRLAPDLPVRLGAVELHIENLS